MQKEMQILLRKLKQQSENQQKHKLKALLPYNVSGSKGTVTELLQWTGSRKG